MDTDETNQWMDIFPNPFAAPPIPPPPHTHSSLLPLPLRRVLFRRLPSWSNASGPHPAGSWEILRTCVGPTKSLIRGNSAGIGSTAASGRRRGGSGLTGLYGNSAVQGAPVRGQVQPGRQLRVRDADMVATILRATQPPRLPSPSLTMPKLDTTSSCETRKRSHHVPIWQCG